MRPYHGTNMKFNTPKLEKCNRYTDFEKGLYLTHELEHAKEYVGAVLVVYNVNN